MKILQVGKAYPPVNLGGVEVVIQLLTEGLNMKKYDCDALGVNDSYTFKAELGKYGGIVFRTKLLFKAFSTLFSFQLITELGRIKSNYDIIHIHSPDPMAAIALFICKPSCKVVLHWHSDILKQKILLFFYKPILWWLINRADLILATSPPYIEGSKYLTKSKFKTQVLPIGLNVEKIDVPIEIDRDYKRKFGNKKIIFSLGRLAYYKGFEYLILSAKFLAEDCIILIAGEGSEYERLNSIIIENYLTDKVILMGKVSDYQKAWLFENCFVFALSSIFKTEAYAIVQVEAMAYGKPIVSTRIEGSGVDWVNLDNYSGITVPTKDPESLGNAIKKILNDPGLCKEFSRNALKRYNQMFTYEVMIQKLIASYNELNVHNK